MVKLVPGRRYIFTSAQNGITVGTFDRLDEDGLLYFTDVADIKEVHRYSPNACHPCDVQEIEPWKQENALLPWDEIMVKRFKPVKMTISNKPVSPKPPKNRAKVKAK